MPSKFENINFYIYLANKGWTYEEALEFYGYLELHTPTAEEYENALVKFKENSEHKNNEKGDLS